VFAFLAAKGNSKEIGEEVSFNFVFRKMLMSAFLLRLRLIISKECLATPIFLRGFQ